jgi:NADPH:quinone reductase-like Zn-dependent oxidoreductase
MKAMICTEFGSPEVLKLAEIEKPFPGDNEVLIRNYAAAVTVSDIFARSGKTGNALYDILFWLPMRIFLGFKGPRKPVLGFDLAGEIETAGKNVKRFRKGDRVFAFTGMKFGAYAEFCVLPEDGVSLPGEAVIEIIPGNITYEEAAVLPSRGTIPLYLLRKNGLRSGHKVLVYGASGGAGTFAVQIAKFYGAEVTGVCSSSNLDFVKEIGADKVIDYTRDNSENELEIYDLVFDAAGKSKGSALKYSCRKALTDGGKYISVDDRLNITRDDFRLLGEIVGTGKVKPVIDREYDLEQLAEAQIYAASGHKRGNIVVRIRQKPESKPER